MTKKFIGHFIEIDHKRMYAEGVLDYGFGERIFYLRNDLMLTTQKGLLDACEERFYPYQDW